MLKLATLSASLFAVALAANAQSGGFRGPDGRSTVTAVAVADLPDDSGVRLVGFIVEAIGSSKYRFRDDTGEVIGAIGVTGDVNEMDDICAIEGIRSCGFRSDDDFSPEMTKKLNIKKAPPLKDPRGK